MSKDQDPLDIDLAEVAALLLHHERPIVLDVRDAGEYAGGCLEGAVCLPQAEIPARIAGCVGSQHASVVLYCSSGLRSHQAAESLVAMGYRRVRSMRGGFNAWRKAGHPWIVPSSDGEPAKISAMQAERYERHLRLPEIGVAGQARLLAARVLCIGAGGLGSPASLYLAAAGIGTLGLIDADVVDVSNLQRQIVHASDRIGMSKVDSARRTLLAINPELQLIPVRARLTADNALGLLEGYDVIIDGSDNFETRYLLNDAALRLQIPVIHAAIQGFQGQVTVFPAAGAPCYRCLFPARPPADAAPSCEQAGVLGVLPGVLGVLQATEAIKLILGIGDSLAGRLLTYDALSMQFETLNFARDPNCPVCAVGVDRSAIEIGVPVISR